MLELGSLGSMSCSIVEINMIKRTTVSSDSEADAVLSSNFDLLQNCSFKHFHTRKTLRRLSKIVGEFAKKYHVSNFRGRFTFSVRVSEPNPFHKIVIVFTISAPA